MKTGLLGLLALLGIEFIPLAQIAQIEGVPAGEILSLISAFGATGVMYLWLQDVRGQLKAERDEHKLTRQQLLDVLKDQNRDAEVITRTRPVPMLNEVDKERFNHGL